MGKISRIHVLTGKKTTLQQSLICEALRAGIPVVVPETIHSFSATAEFVANHNIELLRGLFDDELPEASYGIDPKHPDFDKPLNQL